MEPRVPAQRLLCAGRVAKRLLRSASVVALAVELDTSCLFYPAFISKERRILDSAHSVRLSQNSLTLRLAKPAVTHLLSREGKHVQPIVPLCFLKMALEMDRASLRVVAI